MLAAAFLLPLEVKKNTAGKNSQPFQEDVGAIALSPTKLFQLCPSAPQDGRLEVVVFQRAGAETVAAANG